MKMYVIISIILLLITFPITISDSNSIVATLIDDISDYDMLSFSEHIIDKRIYEPQVIVDAHLPLILSTNLLSKDIISGSKVQNFLTKETSFSSKQFDFSYQMLVNETYIEKIEQFTEEPIYENKTIVGYNQVNAGFKEVENYRYIWKDIKDLNSIEVPKKGYIVVDIIGKTTAQVGNWSIDIIPSVTINNEKHTFNQFAWWNGSWLYSKKVIIDHTQVAGNLYNYPMLFTNKSTDFKDHALASGYDFRFVNEDNTTRFHYEMEYYDSGIGNVTAWVNITFISSQVDTIFWVYYGNAAANTCPTDSRYTWDSHYMFVTHMNDSTTSKIFDSTRNVLFTGTKTDGANHPNVELGKFAMCQNFSDDDVQFASGTDINVRTNDWTAEFWIRPHDTSALAMSFFRYQDASNKFYWYQFPSGGTEYWLMQIAAGIASEASNGAMTYSVNNWFYCAAVADRDVSNYMYKNGKSYALGTNNKDNNARDINLNIVFKFGRNAPGVQPITGRIDETRFSNIARNASWINVTYINLYYPENFMTVSVEYGAGIIYFAPWARIYYPENLSTGICPCCDFLQFSINQSAGDEIDVYVYMNSSHNTTYQLIEVWSQWSNDTLAFCMQGFNTIAQLEYNKPMEFNTTYYWYVYVVNHADATRTNRSDIFLFTTTKNPRNCTTNGTGGGTNITIAKGYGEIYNTVGIVGIIGIVGLLGYLRRRDNDR